MDEEEPSSVFTDDTGTRARALQWATRGLVALLALGAGAVVFSLITQVTLPGLDGPISLPGLSHPADRQTQQPPSPQPTDTSSPVAVNGQPVDQPGVPGSKPSGGSGPSAGSSTTPGAGTTSAPPPSALPTPSKTHSPNPHSNASNAPRATPTHAGGSTGSPPGKGKK